MVIADDSGALGIAHHMNAKKVWEHNFPAVQQHQWCKWINVFELI